MDYHLLLYHVLSPNIITLNVSYSTPYYTIWLLRWLSFIGESSSSL